MIWLQDLEYSNSNQVLAVTETHWPTEQKAMSTKRTTHIWSINFDKYTRVIQ